MSEQDELLIDRYLAKELSEAEQQLFEERKADPAFVEYLNTRKKMDQFVAYKSGPGIKLEDVVALNEKYFSTPKDNLAQKEIQPMSWWEKNRNYLAIAASILLLVLFYFLLQPFLASPPDTDALYAEHAKHQSIDATRSVDINCTTYLDLQSNFNAGAYAMALAAIDNCLSEDPQNLQLQLYQGIALLETQQETAALAIFQGLANGESLLKNEGLWYAALAQLKLGEVELCKSILSKIARQSSRYAKAQELLNQLN